MKIWSDKEKPKAYGFVGLDEDQPNKLPYEPIEVAISDDGKNWLSMFDDDDLTGVYLVDSPAVANPTITMTTSTFGLNDGTNVISQRYGERDVELTFHYQRARDLADSRLALAELQRFFSSRAPKWYAFSDYGIRMYRCVPKEWSISSISPHGFIAKLTLTDVIGLSRSIGNVCDSDEIKGFGNNERPAKLQYSFTGNSFTVTNIGDVAIDPERRGHPLNIRFEGSANKDTEIEIKNETNTTSFKILKHSNGWSGEILLNGVNPYLNGKPDGINTNHGCISLDAGDNKFSVTGFNGSISFEFPVWWLS
ncbi:phage tail domain-containing protein [Limosilactobacillus gorillae]|uniref:phage tail domain-containing protein n=1 Tax=Limosilactobacillus gorillae TaxID=1450649 RepID=UPI000AB93E69|nr:phage tail domain-containing protein [Limosilactobacillus gorillae]